jgi:hypothetical protein
LYDYETWCLALKDEQKLQVSVKNVLRKMLEPEREEVSDLHKEELHGSFRSLRIFRIAKCRTL